MSFRFIYGQSGTSVPPSSYNLKGFQGPIGPTGTQGDLGATGPQGSSIQITNAQSTRILTSTSSTVAAAQSNLTFDGTTLGLNGGNVTHNSTGGFVFNNHLNPLTDVQYNLGSTGTRWHSLYVGTGSVYIGDTVLSSEGDKMKVSGLQLSNPLIPISGYEYTYQSYGERIYTFSPLDTNGVQTFVLPTGTTSVDIECWGAGGSEAGGGYGGYSFSSLTGINDSTELKCWVGGLNEGGKTYTNTLIYPATIIYSLPIVGGKFPDIGYFINEYDEYVLATVVKSGNPFPGGDWRNEYKNGFHWPYNVSVTGTLVNWNNSGQFTGTIFMTGSIINHGTYYLDENLYEGKYSFFTISTGTYIKNVDNNNCGGGASFVYVKTNGTGDYQLYNVGGGGGGAPNLKGIGVRTNYMYFNGGDSNSDSSTDSFLYELLPGFGQIPGRTIKYPIQNSLANGGGSNIGGTGGTGTSGEPQVIGFEYPPVLKGESTMPLVLSNVTSNVSCSGGDGLYLRVAAYHSNIGVGTEPIQYSLSNICGGGGGRGFGGGGGGGVYYSSYTAFGSGQSIERILLNYQTGSAVGGGGGGNYSANGYTYTIGYETGAYVGNEALRNTPGLIKVVCKGMINPAVTVSSSPMIVNEQTKGVSILEDGTSMFNTNVSIGKTNPECPLDVEGTSKFSGDIFIPNYQNIFKKSTFDSELFTLFQNNYNYSVNQPSVNLNYSLAGLSLEIGYLQNAISGLAQLLAIDRGTFDDSGNLTDVPQFIKVWLRNYFPETTSSLTNYTTALKTSLYPSLDYSYENRLFIPYGEFSYINNTQIDPTYFSMGIVGYYIENNKYYSFIPVGQNTGFMPFDIYNYFYYYLLSPYNDNTTIQTFKDLNNPTGKYKANIPIQLYQNFSTVRGVTFDLDLIWYRNYQYGSGPQDTVPYIDNANGNSNHIFNFTYTPSLLQRTFYNITEYYTGTYSSGTFVVNKGGVPYTGAFSMMNINYPSFNMDSFSIKQLSLSELKDIYSSIYKATTTTPATTTVKAAASKTAATTTSTLNVANTLFTSPVAPVSLTVPRTTPATPSTSTVKTAVQPRP